MQSALAGVKNCAGFSLPARIVGSAFWNASPYSAVPALAQQHWASQRPGNSSAWLMLEYFHVSVLRCFSTGTVNSNSGCGKRKVAVAISGGVDSAVAAHLVKQQGHEVFGIFMRNWDEAEETGNQNCSVQADLQDAEQVCQHLSIPLYQVDFVRQYWDQVFQPFLNQISRGLTPNPDLQCNRHIKFQALLAHAKSLGAESVATGHYARLRHTEDGRVELLRAKDREKDQTYFLASVPGLAFKDVQFPLGGLLKMHVRDMAKTCGLHVASRRSSTGICFIGRRNFGQFLEEYAPPIPGRYQDVDLPQRQMPACPNILGLTHGQRVRLSGEKGRMFVVGKDMQEKVVYVASGPDNPALFTHSALLGPVHWVAGKSPAVLEQGRAYYCQYISRLIAVNDNEEASSSRFVCLPPDASLQRGQFNLLAYMPRAARSITPQQSFVMYDGDICLGSASIIHPGKTLWEAQRDIQEGEQSKDKETRAKICAA